MSPEQIASRLKLESYLIQISYKTIYRTIYSGMFDTPEQKRFGCNREAIGKLRHRGKRPKGYVSEIVGFNRKSALLTLVDRLSRFLGVVGKFSKRKT